MRYAAGPMSHYTEHSEHQGAEVDRVEPPIALSHLVHTLRAYSGVIVLAMACVAVAYALAATMLYISSPSQRVTAQPFRLEFRGASDGVLPNGVRFSPTEIVSTPILLRVYNADNLDRFVKFDDFSKAAFVVESNQEYEMLAAEYQARLSDPKLGPIDRERIQKEFEFKRESIKKSDYAIAYAPTSRAAMLPESVVRKVLIDILGAWANVAINEQHALDYRVPVLSPAILNASDLAGKDPVIAIEILRSKIYRVIENVEQLEDLPAGSLVRTADHLTLDEIRIRLEDIVRFRLEPLVGVARASGLVPNPAYTVHFLENQLAYDQRRLQAEQTRVNAARDALLMYTSDEARVGPSAATDTAAAAHGTQQQPRARGGLRLGEGETVVPQLSDSFLDRLIGLSRQATDSQYRLKLIEDYQRSVSATIPLEQAVSYEAQVLEQMKNGAGAAPVRADEKTVTTEIQQSSDEVRQLIGKIDEIYVNLSRNLNPSTQLFSTAGPPVSRIERTRTLTRLLLYGILALLIALPVIIVLCLLHNRVREEEASQMGNMPLGEEPA